MLFRLILLLTRLLLKNNYVRKPDLFFGFEPSSNTKLVTSTINCCKSGAEWGSNDWYWLKLQEKIRCKYISYLSNQFILNGPTDWSQTDYSYLVFFQTIEPKVYKTMKRRTQHLHTTNNHMGNLNTGLPHQMQNKQMVRKKKISTVQCRNKNKLRELHSFNKINQQPSK